MDPNPYSSPAEVAEAPRPSGVRNFFGWSLIVLGVLLPLRMASLAWQWWPLREEEANRCVVLSVLGVMIAFVGCWLRFRAIAFLAPIGVVLAYLVIVMLIA